LEVVLEKYICNVCGWIYDPEKGLSSQDGSEKTAFPDLPENFVCPECGVGKNEFTPLK